MAGLDMRMVIARAIKKADTRYIWEDYSKQADAVVDVLAEHGFHIVPITPTPDMVTAAKDRLQYGVQRPQDMLVSIWRAMVNAAP